MCPKKIQATVRNFPTGLNNAGNKNDSIKLNKEGSVYKHFNGWNENLSSIKKKELRSEDENDYFEDLELLGGFVEDQNGKDKMPDQFNRPKNLIRIGQNMQAPQNIVNSPEVIEQPNETSSYADYDLDFVTINPLRKLPKFRNQSSVRRSLYWEDGEFDDTFKPRCGLSQYRPFEDSEENKDDILLDQKFTEKPIVYNKSQLKTPVEQSDEAAAWRFPVVWECGFPTLIQ